MPKVSHLPVKTVYIDFDDRNNIRIKINDTWGLWERREVLLSWKSMDLIYIDFIDRNNKLIKIDDPFFFKQKQRKSYIFFSFFF